MKIAASSSVWATAGPPASTNCGISVVKTSAIFGFRRFESRPWRNGDVLRAAAPRLGRAAPGLLERMQAEPDEVCRPGELEQREGGADACRRAASRARRNGPHEQPGVDSQRRLDRGSPSAGKAVLENEGHVRPREDDDDSDDADERDYVTHLAGSRSKKSMRITARRMVGRPTSAKPGGRRRCRGCRHGARSTG